MKNEQDKNDYKMLRMAQQLLEIELWRSVKTAKIRLAAKMRFTHKCLVKMAVNHSSN